MSRVRRAVIVAEAERLGLDPNKGSTNSQTLYAAAQRARARGVDGVVDATPAPADDEELDIDLDEREDVGDDKGEEAEAAPEPKAKPTPKPKAKKPAKKAAKRKLS